MNSKIYGAIVKRQKSMQEIASNDNYLKEFINTKLDDLTPLNQESKDQLYLFYRAVDTYAKENNINPCEYIEETGYRIIYDNLILAIGIDKYKECFIQRILDYDYDNGIMFDDIIKYYSGSKKPSGKYLHLTKRAVTK